VASSILSIIEDITIFTKSIVLTVDTTAKTNMAAIVVTIIAAFIAFNSN